MSDLFFLIPNFSDNLLALPSPSDEKPKALVGEVIDEKTEAYSSNEGSNGEDKLFFEKKQYYQKLRLLLLIALQEKQSDGKESPISIIETTSKDHDNLAKQQIVTDEKNKSFLSELEQLNPFGTEEVSNNPGALEELKKVDVSAAMIQGLLNNFLRLKFLKKESDLNTRSQSSLEDIGDYDWDITSMIKHLKTKQYNKVLDDKHGYMLQNGKDETVPFSFYFDLSYSMANFTDLLVTISQTLLQKNVKVLVGFNDKVFIQIDAIDPCTSTEELQEVLLVGGESVLSESFIRSHPKVKAQNIDMDLAQYLTSKKAEKCVIFSDFDPLNSIINLSSKCQTYWFGFATKQYDSRLENFQGFYYPVQDDEDIALGLKLANKYSFKGLCYLTHNKVKVKAERGSDKYEY